MTGRAVLAIDPFVLLNVGLSSEQASNKNPLKTRSRYGPRQFLLKLRSVR